MASLMDRLKQIKRIISEKGTRALPPPEAQEKKEKTYVEDAVKGVKSRRQQEKDILKEMK